MAQTISEVSIQLPTGDSHQWSEDAMPLNPTADVTIDGPQCGRLDPDRPTLLNDKGVTLARRFLEVTQDLSDISQAISAHQEAIEITQADHPDLPTFLSNLGNSFTSRFESTGDVSDIAEAISAHQRAVGLAPAGDENLPSFLNNLGSSLNCRFVHTGDVSDLDQAISARQTAIELTPAGHPNLPSFLNNLANALLSRFERTGDLSAIAEAISAHLRAIELTPAGYPDLPSFLNNFANALLRRFELTGDLSDIGQATSAHLRAVELTPAGHPSLPSFLNSLANSLMRRFDYQGDLSDLAEAISAHSRAVDLTPAGHPDLPSFLNNFANALSRRFEHTGDLSDIAQATSAHLRAVELTPAGHPNLPSFLNNLANSLMRRFELKGDLSDLTQAISAHSRAVDLTPAGHPNLPSFLNNLANSFIRRFDLTGDLSDLAEAVSAHLRVVELTPASDPNLPSFLNNLANSLLRRFERTSDVSDVAEAISGLQRAVALTPAGHPNLPIFLSNLANALERRFEVTHDVSDISQTISTRQMAVETTPADHPNRPVQLANLARCLHVIYAVTGNRDDLDASIESYKVAATSAFASPSVRVNAATRWAQIASQHSPDSPDTLAVFDTALELVVASPDHVGRWLQLNHDMSDLPLQAAAFACSVGRVDKALEWLEQGRSLVWDGLRRQDDVAGHDPLDLERKARAELELTPSPSSTLLELQQLPNSGPVVAINVEESRCDAIALVPGQGEPLHVVLPNFSKKTADTYRELLSSGQLVQDNVVTTLAGLWKDVVKPILDALKLKPSSPSTEPSRIWWCPTGPLAFLPLHAAGVYGEGNSESILDYAVSSYTPSIGFLIERSKNNHSIDGNLSGLLLASQPDTPGPSPTPRTTTEVRPIYESAMKHGVRALKLEGDDLTVEGVLEKMQSFSSVHLACHASEDAKGPLQSKFLLHQGSLELGTIIRKNLKNADLAFLSACQPNIGEVPKAGQVPLAVGMLAAGYRGVVAATGPIQDSHAADITGEFYDYLLTRQSGGNFDGSQSAYALHYAVQKLRQGLHNSEESLLALISYAHFGL